MIKYDEIKNIIKIIEECSAVALTFYKQKQLEVSIKDDNSPVTIEDVIWSYKTLGTIGHWRYRGLWKKIKSMKKTGPRSVKIIFNEDNPELALLAGMRPILKKSQWQDKDFENSSLEIVPISTAAYRISDIGYDLWIALG